jgi:polysaccharide deacetylase family protein (PEP-CTERM system associated)
MTIENFLTVDLEDYYQVSGMADVAPIGTWGDFESRIEGSVERLLEALGSVKATFFVLGWQAERRPEIVRRIDRAGHEIATHGRLHRLVTSLSREEFREDISAGVRTLEDLIGKAVFGHRAPSFSVTDQTPWVFEVLVELGLRYDSSVVPARRSRGGMPGAGTRPYVIDTPAGPLLEFPVCVWKIAGCMVPAAGGGFLRTYPYWLTTRIIRRMNAAGVPAVVYVHPWEADPGQPRLKSQWTRDGFKHYVGLRTTRGKVRRLSMDFKWRRMGDAIGEVVVGGE